jgi:hypothetical protein
VPREGLLENMGSIPMEEKPTLDVSQKAEQLLEERSRKERI